MRVGLAEIAWYNPAMSSFSGKGKFRSEKSRRSRGVWTSNARQDGVVEEASPSKRALDQREKHAGSDDRGGEDGQQSARSTKPEKKPRRPWSPMNYLFWLQGRREHSRSELRTKLVMKLREKDLTGEHDPDELLDKLTEMGLQSDQRFLEGNVRMAAASGRGPGWVKQKLYRHNLDSEAVSQALAEVDDTQWEKEAYDLARRRFGQGPYAMPLRMKAGNFLIRRGFSIDLARRITSSPWPEEEQY